MFTHGRPDCFVICRVHRSSSLFGVCYHRKTGLPSKDAGEGSIEHSLFQHASTHRHKASIDPFVERTLKR
jgi:hypothetical protein